MCPFHDDFSHFFRIYQNKEVARCYHGYCSYAPLLDIVKHQNQCTIPSSSRICIQISFTYPALPNCHFQILPLYYKYLGLIMDPQLKFQSHRDNLHKRLNYKMTFFKKIRKYINIEVAMTIYKSTVLPIIEYADFVHDQNIIYINKKLQTIQNQYLYIVYNQHMLPYLGRQSSDILHREARLFRLDHRRHMHLLSYAYLLTHVDDLMDNRDINTRQHEGKNVSYPKNKSFFVVYKTHIIEQ